MSGLRVHLYGAPRIERETQTSSVTPRKALALLAYVLERRVAVERDALAALLWPESGQREARASLRQTLYTLQRLLPAGALKLIGAQVGISSRADLWVDTWAFRDLAGDCLSRNQYPVASAVADAEALQRLVQAASLCSDEFLAGFSIPDAPEFEDWQLLRREELHEQLGTVLGCIGETCLKLGYATDALVQVRRWIALDPLHEPAHRLLMRLLVDAGRSGSALQQYRRCQRILAEEVGASPAAETRALYESIRAQPPSKSPTPAPRSVPTACPPVRYVASGDVHIAYQVVGEGPGEVLLVPGFVSHLEQIWDQPELARFLREIARHCRLVLFDKRGVGLSDRIGYAPTLDHTMADVLAVMDVTALRRPVLLGVSEGGPNAVLIAATHPQRLGGLVLYGTLPKFTRSADFLWAPPADVYDRWLMALTSGWGRPVSLGQFAPSRANDMALGEWWARLLRLGSSPGGVRAVLDVTRDIDVRALLPAVRLPTLVLHRIGDRVTPVEGARYLADHLPNARLVELPGADHWWFIGDVGPIVTEVLAFLEWVRTQPGAASVPTPDRLLATMVVAIPDRNAEWPISMEAMHGALSRWRGQLAAPVSNQAWLLFDSASRALRFALELSSATDELRVGVQTAEVRLGPSGPEGAAAELAANLARAAKPGQVLTTPLVGDLVTGGGFDFEPADCERLPEILAAGRVLELLGVTANWAQ